MRAKKQLGQNFLHDENIIHQIIQTINPTPKDTIYEIGPGYGAITQHLYKQTKTLHLIELDKELIPHLQQAYGNTESTHIHHLDALKLKLSSNISQIVGNLPYNISTPLLINLLYQADYIPKMVFMLQTEVVDRICSPPHSKTYGRLSVMLQHRYDCISTLEIPPTAFKPQPKVNSSLLLMRRKADVPDIKLEKLEKLLKYAFSQRRKNIKNNLKNFLDIDILHKCHIKPTDRPENLSVDDYRLLSRYIDS